MDSNAVDFHRETFCIKKLLDCIRLPGLSNFAIRNSLSMSTPAISVNTFNAWLLHSYTHTCHSSGTSWVSQYQKSKTNLDFTGARDSEWQWHQLPHMQVCTSLQTDNYASTSLLGFLQAGCPSCRTTNSVKAVKA